MATVQPPRSEGAFLLRCSNFSLNPPVQAISCQDFPYNLRTVSIFSDFIKSTYRITFTLTECCAAAFTMKMMD
jgi:hypothetical protein